jgi:hypothetical protein
MNLFHDILMRAQDVYRASLVLAGLLIFAQHAPSAEPTTPQTSGGSASSAAPNPETEIDTLVRYAMPSIHHRVLDRLAGAWDASIRYCPKPGAEPVESKGTSTRKWILGRRFLLEELDGGNLALPFGGLGLFGYDAFEQQYTSAWVDTMNTSILTNLGHYDRTNEVVQFKGEYKDPWSGTKKAERGLIRFTGQDRHTLELYLAGAEGKEYRMLEIVYSRKPPVVTK